MNECLNKKKNRLTLIKVDVMLHMYIFIPKDISRFTNENDQLQIQRNE